MRSLSRSLSIVGLALANIVVLAQTQKPAVGTIQGIVQSANTPLPGVTVTATNSTTNEKTISSTDLNGQYQLKVPATGAYTVETSMSAFAPGRQQATITDLAVPQRLDFELTLSSRTQQAAGQPAQAQPPRQTLGGRGRGTQTVQVTRTAPDAAAPDAQADLNAPPPTDVQIPGFANDAPTESVAVLGNTADTTFGNNGNFDRQQAQQFIDQQFGAPGGAQGGQGGPGGGGQGGRGGGGGGRGGGGGNRGGGGGNRGFQFGRGGRGFGATTPRGNISYQLADSALNAAPYSLTGQLLTKAPYSQNTFGASLGGPMVIPHIVKSTADSYTVTYTGTRNQNPTPANTLTVPTLLERSGDFSQSTNRNGLATGTPVQLFDPVTHAPLLNNQIPLAMQDPAALGLLNYIPKPNLPGSVQNFQYITTTTSNADNINLRFNHTFANAQQQQGRGGGQRGGGGGGRQGGRGGRGSNINFGLQIQKQSNVQAGSFPTIGGTNRTTGVNATFGYVKTFGKINNSFNVNYNRSNRTGSNLYAFQTDIEGLLGIQGVSQNPFDWGIPSLSFTNFAPLSDIRPSETLNQTFRFTDGMNVNRGKHNLRFGADAQAVMNNNHSTQNSRGTFTFTGDRTAAVGSTGAIQGTGYDFADFLLGLPQQSTVQFGNLTYKFRGTSWDVYLQDDWRIRGTFTLNLGLRYDYASPYTEASNQLVNLDVSPGFNAAAPVLPGAVGPLSGKVFPRGLVNPDRNNVSPRVGFAWRVKAGTIVRASYGITYNTAAYSQIASSMANQPPFSIAATNIFSPTLPLTLTNGFPVVPNTVSNTYGINPNYRIGYAQQWNLDVQKDIHSVQVSLDYTGTKGTRLDVIEAPNRTATGVRIANVQPFNWETSDADSILHSGSIRLNRRLGRGLGFGGTYQFSKSIDNASTVSGGGGGGTVAQDAFNLRAERGLSSFDTPHRLSVNYQFELPFGTNKPFFAESSLWKAMFGDWLFNGAVGVTSGTPLTAKVLGNYTDVTRGSNGSLRPNATGLPVTIAHPSVAEWFNTSAFTTPPAGQFGNVGRNTLRGPGVFTTQLTMQKTFTFADGRALNVSARSNNFTNTPTFASNGVDTTVNSPTFGQITRANGMRTVTLNLRFNF